MRAKPCLTESCQVWSRLSMPWVAWPGRVRSCPAASSLAASSLAAPGVAPPSLAAPGRAKPCPGSPCPAKPLVDMPSRAAPGLGVRAQPHQAPPRQASPRPFRPCPAVTWVATPHRDSPGQDRPGPAPTRHPLGSYFFAPFSSPCLTRRTLSSSLIRWICVRTAMATALLSPFFIFSQSSMGVAVMRQRP